MMNHMMSMRELRQVNTTWLPSKGKAYEGDFEIYVAPLNIRERKLLDNASQADYYTKLIEGIEIRGVGGHTLNPKDLLLADVQFLDLVRRLYTYELDKEIKVVNYPCHHCGKKNVTTTFMFADLEMKDLPDDIYHTKKTYTDDETGEKKEIDLAGKIYKFSDGMEVLVYPLTVGEYIDMCIQHLSNVEDDKMSEVLADLYVAQFTYLIKKVMDREYKDDEAKREFLYGYIANLYKDEDAKVLEEIEENTTVDLIPFTTKCPDCGKKVEVYVQPTCTFQQ